MKKAEVHLGSTVLYTCVHSIIRVKVEAHRENINRIIEYNYNPPAYTHTHTYTHTCTYCA
jgi:hypothetical protein